MLIDFHVHCFPNKIAERAIGNLSYAAGGIKPSYMGSVDGLLSCMDRDGVDKAVVMNIATNTHQQTSVNNFAASICSDRLYCFGSVHPDSPDVMEELERIASLGLKGIKFHPEYQNFYVDEPRMRPIYEKIASLGLMTTFHSGYDVGFRTRHCSPQGLANALPWFNGGVVIAAHFGGWASFDETLQYLCGQPVYLDMSMGRGYIPRPYAIDIIKKHGADKMLFATDSPWQTANEQLSFIDTLELSQDELDMIFYKNAQKLLGI